MREKIEIGSEVVAEIIGNHTGEITKTISGKYRGYDDGYCKIETENGEIEYAEHWFVETKIYHDKIVTSRIARQNAPKPILIRCDCGHSVPKISVMSASCGSSCPDCYDKMSG